MDKKLEAPQEISKQCVMQKDKLLVSLSWQFPSGMVLQQIDNTLILSQMKCTFKGLTLLMAVC